MFIAMGIHARKRSGSGGIPFAAFSNMKCTVALQAGSMIDKHVRMKFNNMARPEERKGKCGKYE